MEVKEKISENGSASVKTLFFLLVVFVGLNAGYKYIPVAFQGENIRQELNTAVIQGVSIPVNGRKPNDLVKEKVTNIVKANKVENPLIEVKTVNNIVQARVKYTIMVPILPFDLYDYQYVFDETVQPGSFLGKLD